MGTIDTSFASKYYVDNHIVATNTIDLACTTTGQIIFSGAAFM
jgi:hypothetical protein